MNKIGEADPNGVSVTMWVQGADVNAADGIGARLDKTPIGVAPNDIRIQARTAKILAISSTMSKSTSE